MALPTRTLGILISLTLSGGMILAAFFLSSTDGPSIAGAGTTEELLKAYASKDSDGDLLFDWQERLYGSDPENPFSLDEEMTDREAVDSGKVKPKFETDTSALDTGVEDAALPGKDPAKDSLTDRFARQFFENYLTKGGGAGVPTGDDLIAFVNSELESVYQNNLPRNSFDKKSLHLVEAGPDALRTYAADIEDSFAAISIKTEKTEMEYFAEAVHGGKMGSLSKVREMGDAYTAMAKGMTLVSVPEDAADAHLATMSSFSAIGTSLTYISEYETDPLLAFVGATMYEESAKNVARSLALYLSVFEKHALTLNEGDPGYSVYYIAEFSSKQGIE